MINASSCSRPTFRISQREYHLKCLSNWLRRAQILKSRIGCARVFLAPIASKCWWSFSLASGMGRPVERIWPHAVGCQRRWSKSYNHRTQKFLTLEAFMACRSAQVGEPAGVHPSTSRPIKCRILDQMIHSQLVSNMEALPS